MSENSATRATLVAALRSLHAMPVENRVRPGSPDVNFAGGWCECKRLAEWPKGADKNPVRLKHPLLQTQKLWIKGRCRTGTSELILVCLHVKRDWLFFDGMVACSVLGEATRPELIENAAICMLNGLKKKELLDWISVRSNS